MIHFRAIEREDLAALRDNRNALMENFRQHKLLNMVNQEDWLLAISRGDEHIMMAIAPEVLGGMLGVGLLGVAGLTYIDWIRRNAEASIYIFPGQVRKGFGSAALKKLLDYGFGELALHRIYAEIWNFNAASLALFEKCRFKREGVSRHAVMHKGEWHDSIMLSILEDEWRSLAK